MIPLASPEEPSREKGPWWVGLPALVPVVSVAGAVALLATGSLPADRTFGVWNWGLDSGKGGFLFACEAQFVVPPDEKLSALALEIPNDGSPDTPVRVAVDGRDVATLTLSPGHESLVDLSPYREAGKWITVRIETDRWCGRGALGTPLGVKPYAIAVRKIRPPSASP